MEQLLIEADEAWALYAPEESRYCWCNPSYRTMWGAEPSDPWTLFALPPGPYHGTLRLNDEEIAVRVIPDNNHYLVHCRNQNLGLYREAFHKLPLGLVLTRIQDGIFFDLNSTAGELSGYRSHRWTSTMSLWRAKEHRDYYIKHLLQHGSVQEAPFPYLNADGQPVDSVSSAAHFTWQGQSYLIGTLASPAPDSTLLHTKIELLQQIFEYAPALIVLADDSGRMQKVNRAVCALSGYTAAELQNKPFYELIPPEERVTVQQVVEQCFNEREVTYSENHWITNLGERRLLQWSNTRLRAGFNDEILHVGIARDVTEQRQAESQLQEAEKRYRSLVDNAPDAILEISSNGTVTFANPAARQAFGAILNTQILNYVHEDDWQRVADEMQKPRTDVHCRMRHCQDGWRWFDCKGQAGILICRDVTAERTAQAKNTEAHKMQAVGAVAASLADEFLQLQKKLEATLEKAAAGQAAPEDFAQARQALQGAEELASQLRKLNKEAQFEPERATLENIVEGASQLLSASLNKVRIQLDLKTQESWLRGGRAQIEQMLLNLGLSVVHPGTTLHISTLPVSPQERQILSLDQASQWVELRITQNPTGNLYGGVTLDQAVVVPGDPFRIFLPLIR